MSTDLLAPEARFGAFGFVVLRGAITPTEADALRAEAERAIRDATGPWYRRRAPGGGIEGHYVPATGENTPLSLRLAERSASVVQRLTGLPMLLAFAHHNLLFDEAPWHTDTGHAVPSVKVVAYLDTLDASSGALRVVPCSHDLADGPLRSVLRGPAFRDDTTWRDAAAEVPAVALDTRPGDVIVFDERLWHASLGGRDRLQWSAVYVVDPRTSDEAAAVAAYLASQFEPGEGLDYDPVRYPSYGDHFRRCTRRRWVDQLERLGAFTAAAAAEAGGRRPPPA